MTSFRRKQTCKKGVHEGGKLFQKWFESEFQKIETHNILQRLQGRKKEIPNSHVDELSWLTRLLRLICWLVSNSNETTYSQNVEVNMDVRACFWGRSSNWRLINCSFNAMSRIWDNFSPLRRDCSWRYFAYCGFSHSWGIINTHFSSETEPEIAQVWDSSTYNLVLSWYFGQV